MNTSAHRSDAHRPSHDVRRARRAFLLVGLIAPIVIAALALIPIAGWLPELPGQVVTHWGPNGPDGFGSPVMYVWMQVIIGFGTPVLLASPVLFVAREAWGFVGRFLGALSLGFAAFISVAMAGSVALQRGDGDPDGIGIVLVLATTGLLVFGALGWFLQPRVTVRAPAAEAAQLGLAPGERAAWFGTVAIGRAGAAILVLAVLLLVCSTIWMLVLSEPLGFWVMAAVTVFVIALVAATLVFRVRISQAGLRVRSVIGWPRWEIPAADITGVQVVDVNPMAEFGGWGVRVGLDGRMGIVLRTGEGIQVTRRQGRPLVVTIDDAATAASVLNATVKGVNS